MKTDTKKIIFKRSAIAAMIFLLLSLTNCSHYNSSWSCKNPEGIGCSSIGYADRVAKKHIVLNENNELENIDSDNKDNKQNESTAQKHLLIKEHYSDFTKHERKEVDID